MDAGRERNEILLRDALCSEQWDCRDGIAPLARYVVFSAQRTGSTWLSVHLRQQGIGVPFEYFNPIFMKRIGARLGCMLSDISIDIVRYIALLEPRRTRLGIFGTKLQPDQLRTVSAGDPAEALAFLRRFDKVILLRRRDKLLQAISLARAQLTDQWQLYGNDKALGIHCGDDVLFPMISAGLRKIQSDESYMTELAAGLRPEVVRTLWYEDLSDPGVFRATADWIWAALRSGARPLEPDQMLELPRKMNEAWAVEIRRRYLSFIGAV